MTITKTAAQQGDGRERLNQPPHFGCKTITQLLPILCLTAGLSLNSINAHATNWQYLGGSSNYNPANGQPIGMTDKSSVLPVDLLATVLARLPEGQPIGNNQAALDLLTNDEGANIFLKANANIKISYVSEGAGYLNSVGFFKFPKADLTTLSISSVIDTIIFPNFSDNVLQFGKTVDLGNFVAGDAIGFTIIANGWIPYVAGKAAVPAVPAVAAQAAVPAVKAVKAVIKNGIITTPARPAIPAIRAVKAKAAVPAVPAVLSSGGIVDPNKAASKIFRTIKRFNPEPVNASNLQAHTILFSYPEKELLVLAFEDLNRQSGTLNDYNYTSDNDFNDVIIAIHVSPFPAVDCAKCNLLVPDPICKTPVTTTPIPAAAMMGNKVNICHNTASTTNPTVYVSVSENAVTTHLSHHDDTFQMNGVCPLPTAELCSTTPVCTIPEAYNPISNSCCAAPKTYHSETKSCDPIPIVNCTAPEVRDEVTNTCITPASGESGPISWREITTPPEVTGDVNKATKAVAKANGNGNGNNTVNTTIVP